MRYFRSVWALVLVSSICGVSIALAQDCKCKGNPISAPYAGGNGQPLKWAYSPHLISAPPLPAPKLICYFKQVDNKGNTDVRDVRWEVANFFRRVVPKGVSSASCPEMAGDTKPAPTNGPLYYGPSSEAYDTTVLQPKDGWSESASNSADGSGTDAIRIADARLNSALTFYADDRQGKPVPARLVFSSDAKASEGTSYFTYFVANASEVPLGVFVNLSATPTVLETVPMLQRIFWIEPGEKRVFNAVARGRNSIERATIVVYDMNKNVSAIDSAAFYTVPGKKEVSDETIWQRLK
jgi:hypothetical protein